MSKKRKLLIIIPALLMLLVCGGLLFAGNYMVDFAIVRKEETNDVSPDSVVSVEDAAIIDANKAVIETKIQLWQKDSNKEIVSIMSDDGLKLVAEMHIDDENNHKWMIGVHGYNSNRGEYYKIACHYAEKGYNILLPDMRSHGESEGKYIGMGRLEKDDMLLWLDYVLSIDPQAEIIVHGTSMGGATVMLLSGETLPDNVKGIIEDCGYSSVWNIFADELKYMFGLPTFPVLDASEFVASIRAGYVFRDASCVERVKKATVPMLFIHGSADNFVHTEMVYEVYEACPTTKDLLIVEGAGHAESCYMDPDVYFNTVFDFIEKNCIK